MANTWYWFQISLTMVTAQPFWLWAQVILLSEKPSSPYLFLPAGRTCFWSRQIPLAQSLLQLAIGRPTLLVNKAQNNQNGRSHNDQAYV